MNCIWYNSWITRTSCYYDSKAMNEYCLLSWWPCFTGTSLVLWYSSSGMRPCVGRRETPDRSIGVIYTTIPTQGTSSGRNTAATRKTSIQWFSICTITVSIISFKVKYKMKIFCSIKYFPEIKEVKLFYTHTIFRHKIT